MDRTEEAQTNGRITTWLGLAARLAGRFVLTAAVVVGAAFAVQYGTAELTRRAEAAPSPDAAPAIPVQTVPLRLETGYDVQRAFVGQNEPQRTVSVSFELAGQLASIVVDEGDAVRQGQVLATQDTSLLDAERTQLLASKSAAEAQLKFAFQTVERNEELNRRGFATQAALDGASAQRDELIGRIAEIDAAIANVDIRIAKSRIEAPFDGRVTSRFVDGREALNPGQQVLKLIELRAPQVRVGVPLDFDETRLANAEMELAGQVYTAALVALRPDIDPVTRTRTALFSIDADAKPAFGQTARLLVTERVDATGLWLPMTSLKEGVRGQWTVLTVDAGNMVRRAPVEILHAESDRVFVRGAFPDGTRLIGEGPQRVTVGQRVASIFSE